MHDGNKWLRKGGDDGAPLSTDISENEREKYFIKLTEQFNCFTIYWKIFNVSVYNLSQPATTKNKNHFIYTLDFPM